MDVKDFFVEVQKGTIAEHSIVYKFGRNGDVPNGSWEIVSPSNPSGSFPASPTTVRIKAGGNVADVVDGSGAREITIVGIDVSLAEVTETISTSGAGVSAVTTASFWRVYRAYVSDVGTYGEANTGDIVIEDSAGTVDKLTIVANEGQTQHGTYSIPNGKIGYLLSMHVMSHATKAADFRLYVRENFTNTSSSMASKRIGLFFEGVVGQVDHTPQAPCHILSALSDIWLEARGGGANTEVSVDFEILLVDNSSGPVKAI